MAVSATSMMIATAAMNLRKMRAVMAGREPSPLRAHPRPRHGSSLHCPTSMPALDTTVLRRAGVLLRAVQVAAGERQVRRPVGQRCVAAAVLPKGHIAVDQ